MFWWRITKYNPIYRNEKGYYLKDEWSDFSCADHIFGGEKLTID